VLVTVHGGAVDMPVADGDRALDGGGDVFAGEAIRAERPQPDSGDFRGGVKGALRHLRGIDTRRIKRKRLFSEHSSLL
jgi:hypothetical protein